MQKLIIPNLFLLSILLLTNCSKDIIESEPLSKHGYLMIQSIDIVRENEISRKVEMFYNEEEQVIRAEEPNRIYDFEYDINGQLLQVFTENLENNTRMKSDSFTYQNSGRLKEHFKFSRYSDSTEVAIPWLKHTYQYNLAGKVEEGVMTFFDSNDPDYERITTYKWNGDNIEHLELDDPDFKWFDADFKYDNAFNYKFKHPYFLMQEAIQSSNNIVEANYSNVAPHINIACYECSYQYRLNQDNAVIEEEMNVGNYKWLINY